MRKRKRPHVLKLDQLRPSVRARKRLDTLESLIDRGNREEALEIVRAMKAEHEESLDGKTSHAAEARRPKAEWREQKIREYWSALAHRPKHDRVALIKVRFESEHGEEPFAQGITAKGIRDTLKRVGLWEPQKRKRLDS